jgi:hypothetical protein
VGPPITQHHVTLLLRETSVPSYCNAWEVQTPARAQGGPVQGACPSTMTLPIHTTHELYRLFCLLLCSEFEPWWAILLTTDIVGELPTTQMCAHPLHSRLWLNMQSENKQGSSNEPNRAAHNPFRWCISAGQTVNYQKPHYSYCHEPYTRWFDITFNKS